MLTREDISDTAWKWRYKLTSACRPHQHANNKNIPKDLSATFTEEDTLIDKLKPATLSTATAPKEQSTLGADVVTKTFYEGKNSDNTFFNWVDYPPRQISKSAAKAQDRVAIKVYKVKDKAKPVMVGKFALKHHMVEIQSPVLVAQIKDVMRKEGVHLDVNEVAVFKEPFRALYFCWEEIKGIYKAAAAADEKGERTSNVKALLALLLGVMQDIFSEVRAKVKHLQAAGLVSYKEAWTYFPTDSTVYSWGTNCELLCKVKDAVYKTAGKCGPALLVSAKVIDFNGKGFIWKDVDLEIPKFEGNMPVVEMPHYPLRFHEDAEGVNRKLLERGRRVLDFQGLTYCSYNGVGIYKESRKLNKHNVEGRILIDVTGYNKYHLAQGKREGQDPEMQKNRIIDLDDYIDSDLPPPPPAPASVPDARKPVDAKGTAEKKSSAMQHLSEEEQKKNKDLMLSREHDLIFIAPLLGGYALTNKMWLNFYVDDIEPIAWNDEAYDHLVYDEQQKDLVLSFVENHRRTKEIVEHDVIKGKGQGLIILLSGPPGTGKTLTAEAVADRTRRPLFYLQAEDLGVNAAMLGANIKNVFAMATEWDAVILLDEADVFMAERHPSDITRNELVSIFLRELEYFRGIIFLTTNLYDTIDTAFRSRVNIHLLFKPLSPEARVVLWRKFLERLNVNAVVGREDEEAVSRERLTEEDLKELGKWQLNGREIKNAIKMVKSWCDAKDYEMTLTRLESGIKVTAPHATRRDDSYPCDLYE
ncbi:P-loop containing nucleoside triphosphate hydrolase protein [Zopfia rhizophila CBS 207.26]|uniref:P-loop containing nucleoside triphosphate hydrolase protein n=1 Tax=Zopfia rhizophila CBS 207.26 TaxID=1314779 RepID=A0A6A6DFU6_9PEZI|nr:P-loop containing nucleoside triphosphate hydrolase protein [Zopfia rhizophila CBS 207.26]